MQDFLTLKAMALSSGASKALDIAIVFLVLVLFYTIIWIIARAGSAIIMRTLSKHDNKIYHDMREAGIVILPFALLFCWAPMGSLIALLAGFIRTPYIISLGMIALGQAGYLALQYVQLG